MFGAIHLFHALELVFMKTVLSFELEIAAKFDLFLKSCQMLLMLIIGLVTQHAEEIGSLIPFIGLKLRFLIKMRVTLNRNM